MTPLRKLIFPGLLTCGLLGGGISASLSRASPSPPLEERGKWRGSPLSRTTATSHDRLVSTSSITDVSVNWPGRADWKRVLLLQDYNTRVVVGGTALLGVAAGVIGSFTLLRKRALTGDALSHAMLPGIGLAFMLSVAAGGTGKSLPVLLAGATLSGALGFAAILLLRGLTRLKEDTALGIVLSVFFGAGGFGE